MLSACPQHSAPHASRFFELKDLNRLSAGSALVATFGRYGNQHPANYASRQYGQQGSYLLASPKSCWKFKDSKPSTYRPTDCTGLCQSYQFCC